MSEPAEIPETGEIVAWLRREAEHARDEGLEALDATLLDAADRLVEQANQLAELRALVEDLVSEDDCDHDHLWYCKTHIWFDDGEACPHQRAKELGLGAVEQYANQPRES